MFCETSVWMRLRGKGLSFVGLWNIRAKFAGGNRVTLKAEQIGMLRGLRLR